jgi:putative ABC transport system permease protein
VSAATARDGARAGLAGAEPAQAVRYQLLIVFLIAGATGLGATGAVLGGILRLTDGRHRRRLDRLADC